MRRVPAAHGLVLGEEGEGEQRRERTLAVGARRRRGLAAQRLAGRSRERERACGGVVAYRPAATGCRVAVERARAHAVADDLKMV